MLRENLLNRFSDHSTIGSRLHLESNRRGPAFDDLNLRVGDAINGDKFIVENRHDRVDK